MNTATQRDVSDADTRSTFKIWLNRDWVFVAAVLVGAGLRLYQLGDQIIADDEWHALHAARDYDFRTIAEYFGSADISIPLALIYKAASSTIGLSELVMRTPVILFGLMALVVLPLLVRKIFYRTTGTL